MQQSGSGSISFDRAADVYDRSRGITSDALRTTIDLLVSELAGLGSCLEIGTGTGAISLALGEAGIPVVGIDLAMSMLAKLIEKDGGRRPFPIALADATEVPFRNDVFGGAVVRHVLHLIPAWETAVAELTRVVRPGGVILVNPGSFGGIWRELNELLLREMGEAVRPVGLDHNDTASLDRAMKERGARFRELPAVVVRDEVTLREYVRDVGGNAYSWTWRLDDAARARAVAVVRAWGERRFGGLDEPIDPEVSISWRAYDLP